MVNAPVRSEGFARSVDRNCAMRRPITAEERSSELRSRVDWKRAETLVQHLPVHVDSLDKVTNAALAHPHGIIRKR